MTEQDPPQYDNEQMNKRRNLRSPLIVEKIPCGDGHKTFFGYAKNISQGGLFISTVKPREPGEQFLIEMVLPGRPGLTVRGTCEVVWKQHFVRKGEHEPGMGLKFLDLPAEVGGQIDRWVLAQSEQTGK
jgi:uncharacterized protein (TIGR02266 family)